VSLPNIFHGMPSNPATVLGAMSKALATILTQPLIVAKVGLQSRPPPDRKGKPFKTFGEVMKHIIDQEGPLALFKGIGPQILKGLFVQGILMMTKERMELLFVVLFAYVRQIRDAKMKQAAEAMRSGAATASDQISETARSMKLKETADAVTSKASTAAESVSDKAKHLMPVTLK
jgi:Mitochondrial carrier protein